MIELYILVIVEVIALTATNSFILCEALEEMYSYDETKALTATREGYPFLPEKK